jgi:spermidine synthase
VTRLLALLLTTVTGFSGLVYEVTWQKYLATLLGSHSEATAAVLGLFLGGMAAGYALFGKLTRRLVSRAEAAGRPPRVLLAYGVVEAAIGLYAFAFPVLFAAVQRLSFAIPHGPGGIGFAVDVGLSALLIGPPAILMGATIPVLTQALARSLDDATRFHAFVYAFNTAGAFAGALAAGFVLLPWLGLVGTLFAMGTLNLAAGAIFALLGLRARPVARLEGSVEGSPARGSLTSYAFVAVLVGFAMMAIQTTLMRLGGLSFGSSEYTFAMVVAVFVLCIALGSFAVSALPRIPAAFLLIDLWALVLLLYLLYDLLPQGPYWIHVLRTSFPNADAAFLPFHAAGFGGVLAVIGLPVLLSGATLPLLFHQLRREVGELGAVAGQLYSWNTLGSLAGALLGGYALLFWLDLHHVYRIAVGSLVLAASVVTARLTRLPQPISAIALLLLGVAALAVRAPWNPDMMSAGLFRIRQAKSFTQLGPAAFQKSQADQFWIRFYDDDPSVTVTVTEFPAAKRQLSRSIITNGKPDGNTAGDYTTMGMVAVVPALLADRMERAFVIGFGTGITAGEFASLDSTREVVVAEISSGVLRAAPLFDFSNQNASRHPKIRLVRSDAYRALMRSEGLFDVIVSEPSNPWVTGVEMLFSREFLEAARDRLSPGGVYAQWFHQYETSAETVELVLRTYASVFDHVSVWFTLRSDLMILGLNEQRPALDLERILRRTRRPDVVRALRRLNVNSPAALLAHELLPLGVVHAAQLEGPIHTLLWPRLSHVAGRAFFRGGTGRLPFTGYGEAARIGRQNSLLRRYFEHWQGDVPAEVRASAIREVCRQRSTSCATLLADWQRQTPDSPELAELTREATRQVAFPGPLDPQVISKLAVLFGGDSPTAQDSIPISAARQATQRYTRFYHHATPFSADGLLRIWSRCAPDPKTPRSCAQGTRRAQALLLDGARPARGSSE